MGNEWQEKGRRMEEEPQGRGWLPSLGIGHFYHP